MRTIVKALLRRVMIFLNCSYDIAKVGFILILFILLTACNRDDETTKILVFEEMAFIQGMTLSQATGFTGSKEYNSLYIVNRDVNSWPQYTERVIKYDLGSGEQYISNVVQVDYISKNVHLINGDLIVVGGTRVNVYPENLESPPTSVEHGLALSRFGSAIYEDELYVWGGDLHFETSKHIRKWDFENNKFETIGLLPSPRMWAHGEIINDKLFVFGGQEEFVGTPSSDIIYVYDFLTNETETYFLPEPMIRTFTAVHGDRIYVAGHVLNEDDEIKTMLGVFNTKTNMNSDFLFSENNDEVANQIVQMTIVDDRLYILMGPLDDGAGVFLQVADL